KAGDFRPGATAWNVGDEVWYYVLVTDNLSNLAYQPARANPAEPAHNGTIDDQWHFVILPQFPTSYHGPRILLVDGHNRRLFDYSPCLSTITNSYMLEDMYEKTLVDAGYCYDKYDINGAGTNQAIHPIWFTDYDAVVWFTGPYFSDYLFWKEAQVALRSYMAGGGKVVLCGDRIAFDMAPMSLGGNGGDSLGGQFLSGVMGASYLKEMETAFSPGGLPFIYAQGAPTVSVFGTPVATGLDSVLIYRECPYLKDMSYVQANPTPPTGYTAQPLLHMLNPVGVPHADEAVYVEYQGRGQCVFVNFDLSAVVNHVETYCDGNSVSPAPDFAAGTYAGRVNLMRTILETIFGLPSNGGGTSGVATPEPKTPTYHWALAQNVPNPCVTSTSISFELAQPGQVTIKVYNATGQVVRTLANERRESGRYSVTWNGTNDAGVHVSSGVYFYKLDSIQFSATRKMLVIQ
ncbi:MAG TPA: FlgD immunoglobulin-like domain containing protein, partial [bacterium]|nr:FlgD immunoglobulin-like domain containing protein [bacterium]